MTSAGNGAAGPPRDNAALAKSLDEIADLLEGQGANVFRTGAYREAAGVVRSLDRPVVDILAAEGTGGLLRLPKIGPSISRTLDQLVHNGTTPLLERLRGAFDPERALATVPGLGRQLAVRVHKWLGVETLEDLEAAAWDGRLEAVPGFGPRRVRAVRESLAGRLARRQPAPIPSPPVHQPPVSELLSVDEEYRRKAAAGQLLRIIPRRFNPTHATWLPILHTGRGDRHYTALFSNTARAHTLGTTRDWVVIYRDDPAGHGQWTAITARLGPLHGKRIVRGREDECVRHYADGQAATEWGRRLL